MATEIITPPGAPGGAPRPEEAPDGFNFKGTTRLRRRVQMYIVEPTQAAAHSQLEAAGITPASIWKRRTLRRKSRGVPKRALLATSARQIGEQLHAGESISRVCTMQAKATNNLILAAALKEVAGHVREGSTFSQALAKPRLAKKGDKPGRPTGERVFPMPLIYAVRVGESTGSIPEQLYEFADSEEKSIAVFTSIKSAAAYPAFLFVASSLLILGLMYFIVPKFLEQIESLAPNMELPLPTVVVMWLNHFLISPLGIASVVSMPVLGLAAWRWLKTDKGRLWFQRNSIKWPLVGQLLRDYWSAFLLRNFATLLNGNSDIHAVLKELAATLPHVVYREMIEDILKVQFDDAKHLSVPFKPWAFLMGDEFYTVLKTWENGGDVIKGFKAYAEVKEKRVDRAIATAMKYIEPTMIIGMGFIVVVTVLAVYWPMFKMIGTMAGK